MLNFENGIIEDKEDNNISYTIENVKSNFEKDYYKIEDLISMYNLDLDCLKKAENVSFLS